MIRLQSENDLMTLVRHEGFLCSYISVKSTLDVSTYFL